MKTFVIIGLSNLAVHLLEDLSKLDCQIIIIDNVKETVEENDMLATESFIIEQFTKASLKKIIPFDTDAVIIDFNDNLGKTCLVTHYCNLLGVKEIYVKTEEVDNAEILKTLGATKIIFPSKDAAKRLTPLLISPTLSTYSIIGHDIVVAETTIPKEYVGKTLFESDLRFKKGITVIAVRNLSNLKYDFIGGDYYFLKDDRIVICGRTDNVEIFTNSKDLISKTNLDELASQQDESKKIGIFSLFNFLKRVKKSKK